MDIEFLENRVYAKVKVEEGYYKLRSSLVDEWIRTKKDVIVINETTQELALLTTYDLCTNATYLPQKYQTYQDGVFSYIQFEWIVDERIKLPDWHKAMLKRIHPEWFNLLEDYIVSTKFMTLMKELNLQERKKFAVYPSMDMVFRAFESRPDKVRAVIIGQDPYSNGFATGLAFGTYKEEIPPSLQAIVKVIRRDFDPKHYQKFDYTLESWERQGILLLNTSLTLRASQPLSHIEYWKAFIRRVIIAIVDFKNPIPIILLGNQAKEYSPRFYGTKHYVFEAEHPDVAFHQNREWDDNEVFKKADEMLKAYGKPINWLL